MGLINFQPEPHVPPIGFFEPISADPEDMMTDVEFLLGVVKKLNEIITQVNSNTEFIEQYSGKIEELEGEIAALRDEMSMFEAEVNDNITQRFNQIMIELRAMITTTLNQANAYTDLVAQGLENEIQNIAIGQITLYDPSTGMTENLQTVIDNLYNASREDALTAEQYDNLELSATVYDAYELTAADYDRYAKNYLLASV